MIIDKRKKGRTDDWRERGRTDDWRERGRTDDWRERNLEGWLDKKFHAYCEADAIMKTNNKM